MINLGFSTNPVWLKFRIRNLTNAPLYLYMEAQEIDFVEIFVVGIDSSFRVETGALRPYGSREFNINSIVTPLGNRPQQLYISIKDINRLVFPLKLCAVGPLVDKVYHESLVNAFVAGIMILVLLFSFFMYLNLRDIIYLIYAGHIFFSILTMLVFEGYLFELLWRDMPYLNNSINSNLVRLFTLLSGMAFSIYFLKLKLVLPRIVQVYIVLAILAFMTIPVRILGFTKAEMWFNMIVMTVFLSYFFTGFWLYRQGFKPARFYLLGWGIYIIEIILLMLTSFDVLSFGHLYTYYGYQIGSVFQAIFLTLALSDRIQVLRRQAIEAQYLALHYMERNQQMSEEQNQPVGRRPHLLAGTKNHKLGHFHQSARTERQRPVRISIATMEGVILCAIPDIVRVEAQGSYTYVWLHNGQKILASRTLSTFEKQLRDYSEFIKIHKSHLVNMDYVSKYQKGDGGRLTLKDGTELGVSRTAKAALLRQLGLD